MSSVVFLRGVNVAGHKRFQPALLAGELAHLGVVNVGAAGTFVVRGTMDRAALRAELAGKLPFQTDLMICAGRELLQLPTVSAFADARLRANMRRCVSVLAQRPPKLPPLPRLEPSRGEWQLKIVQVTGRFALCFWRRLGRRFVDPNAVVEKIFGIRATTRNWNTIVKICGILRDHAPPPRPGTAGAV